MMTVEDLRRAREESNNVVYMTFCKHIQANKSGLLCFFEGKDSPFYGLRIGQIFDGNYYPIICFNKSNVLKAYELIHYHREYDKYKKGFFVDSDFDIPISNEHIFETPCYSIENLYTGLDTFAKILKSEVGLTEVDDDFDKCVALYEKLQNEFHDATTLFNAWYACLVDIKHSTKQEMGASLTNFLPNGFITISLDTITFDYDMVKIRNEYPNSLNILDEDINDKIIEFSTKDKRKIFRGKFELSFMLRVFQELFIDSKNSKNIMSKERKLNTDYSIVISRFSQYAETPPELVAYIQQIIS